MNATIQGRTVSYIEQGTGKTVLLLHGWAAPAETYRLVIDHLSVYCRVVAPDLPGFGGSDEPETAWCVDDYVDFVIAFCRELDLKPDVLMGHSFGGRIIIKLMNRPDHPVSCEKIVLMDAAGIRPKRHFSYYVRVYSFKAAKRFLGLPGVRNLFPHAVENMRKRRGSADYRNASDVMRQSMVRAINEDLTALLPGVTPSTLLIWGELDRDTPLSDGQTMERMMPDAGLVTLQGAGHFAFAERWGQCSRVLDSFLK